MIDLSDVLVRPAEAQDFERWNALWQGYVRFYRGQVPDEVTRETWRRILDAGSAIHALVAERDGQVIGLCNYVLHDSTWDVRPICYLQDLYVDPESRGGGAARKLIEACEQAARAAGCFRVYWQTQEYNAPARSLYDTIVPRSSFIVYRKNL